MKKCKCGNITTVYSSKCSSCEAKSVLKKQKEQQKKIDISKLKRGKL